MTARLLIDCVDKDDRLGPYERITGVGGPNLPGVAAPDESRFATGLRRRGFAVIDRPRWTLSLDDAIEGVLDGRWTFFVQSGAYGTADVQVATSASGGRFLRTETDVDTPDELLCLPQWR